jgi:tetratricopeptide (TPR) repeat protein
VHGDPYGRYQLHELLRQFGAEKLTVDVANDIRQRHSCFYAAYTRQREPYKRTAQEPAALQEIGVELENIRAGWLWAAAHLMESKQTLPSAEIVSAYAPMLCYFFDRRSRYREGCQLFRQMAASFEEVGTPQPGVGEPNREIGRAFMWVRLGEAILRLRLGEFGEAEQLLNPARSRSHQPYDPRLVAEALSVLGTAYMRMGKYDQAQRYLQESLGLYTAIDDSIGRTVALDGLGLLAFDQHQFSEAQAYWQACLATFRATGYQWGIAKALSGLASNMGRHGIYEQAKQLIEEALPIAESVGGEQLVAVLLSNLGSASRHLSDHENSVRYYQRSLDISRRIGDKRWTAATLNGLGITLAEMGRFAAAKAHVLEALELSKTTGNVPDVLDGLSVLGQTLATDAVAEAVALLSLVANHPITRQLARDRSQQALDRLKESVSPAL